MTESLLTIAGSDPSGGAGIQVDLQVFRDFGFHGLSVLSAVVSQNTRAVRSFEAVPPVHLEDQIDGIFEDIRPAAVKIGMVPTPEAADVIGGKIPGFQGADNHPVVYDPVLASGSGGSRLVRRGTREQLVQSLIPKVDWLTPNLLEAQDLLKTGIKLNAISCDSPTNTPDVGSALDAIRPSTDDRQAGQPQSDSVRGLARLADLEPDDLSLDDVETIAHGLRQLGTTGIIVTGGHLPALHDDRDVSDLLVTHDRQLWGEPLPSVDVDVRGTGCQLSSAFAAGLACGNSPVDALDDARHYLNDMLRHHAEFIGTGRPVVVRTPDNDT